MIRRIPLILPFVALVVVVACSDRTPDVIAYDLTPPPAFVDPDAGANKPDGNDLITYCPSDRCPAGHTTCPSSPHLCDVDLRTDVNNCGECGNACPKPGGGEGETYACIEGRCTLTCDQGVALDCDGVPDNGCEARLPDNDNCGACGLKCPADTPCIDRSKLEYRCGCKPGELLCPGSSVPMPGWEMFMPCVDPETDDKNCGACRNACPPEGDGSREPPPNMYFGCVEGQCGVPKCEPNWGDCDRLPENGCETSLADDNNCFVCGNRCVDGATCRLRLVGLALLPACMCPEGETFCKEGQLVDPVGGATDIGRCADLTASITDCGACGARCDSQRAKNMQATCVYGRCEQSCIAGWGDCNGNSGDGCETDLNADPMNCGECGRVCDGIAGQACVDGQCMVEPCNVLEDAGGPTR